MASLIPETALRLQACAFVSNIELQNVGGVDILHHAAEQMVDGALRKLLNDCVSVESDGDSGYTGKKLRFDVYVLAPHEMHRMIADARMQGERDAVRWSHVGEFND